MVESTVSPLSVNDGSDTCDLIRIPPLHTPDIDPRDLTGMDSYITFVIGSRHRRNADYNVPIFSRRSHVSNLFGRGFVPFVMTDSAH